jgi:SpoVK/Ycf46/Vps4 family AAA+-type ATPase
MSFQRFQPSDIMSYESLLEELAKDCVGYSGAALAGVARAAASHALERAVNEFSQQVNGGDPTTASSTGLSIMDCLVTREDFNEAVADVLSSMGNSDHSDEDSEDDTSKEGMPAETDNAKAPFNESPDDSISP